MDTIGYLCTFIVVQYTARLIIKFLYNNFLAYRIINTINLRRTGEWAVVTGATDGIGKAYAEALAKKRLNVVLISRTQAKLDAVRVDIQKKYNVKTKTIAADFTSISDIYGNIDKQLQGLNIGILINNVGMYYPHPEYFSDLNNKDEIYNNMIRCNISSVVNMCQIILPGMVARKRGVIVNVSSLSSLVPSPLVCVYSGSKAFVNKFSADLATEYRKDGITVQCLVPGWVATKMSGEAESCMAPSAATYVQEAIKTIGIKGRTTGYFPHTLLMAVVNFFDSIVPWLVKKIIIKIQLNIRSKALKKR